MTLETLHFIHKCAPTSLRAWQRLLGGPLAAVVMTVIVSTTPAFAQPKAVDDRSIRPFTIHVPEAALQDLRRRIAATRWPDRETVSDRTQGTQLAKPCGESTTTAALYSAAR